MVFHSFRGGTGKSNICANLACLLASRGKIVGAMDLDLMAPGLHVLFKIQKKRMKFTLNDYFVMRCSIKDVVIDVTRDFEIRKGRLFFIPASYKKNDILKSLKKGYEIDQLIEGFNEIIDLHDLDFLLVDTHPGVHEDNLLAAASCDRILNVMRLDEQDYLGTSILLELFEALGKSVLIVVNSVPPTIQEWEVRDEIERFYKKPVIAVVHFSEDVLFARSRGIFVAAHPNHPWTTEISRIMDGLLERG